jgi:nucleoside-diphosphate-sugar epimerase
MGLGFARIQKGFFPLIAEGEALLQPIYVQDVVDALILAKERDEALGQVYNVAGEQMITFKEFFAAIADAFGVDSPKRNLSRRIAWTLGYLMEMKSKLFGGYALLTRFRVECSTRNMTYDISKAEKQLGFHPKVNIEEGVKRTVEWYQSST